MSLRVVVTDNDPDALDLVVTDLTLEGHEVVGRATNGDDALAVCRDERPQVVVLDVRMPPGIDGIEVARRLRDEQPDLRIVLYTNHFTGVVLRAARSMGLPVVRKGNLRSLRRALHPGSRT